MAAAPAKAATAKLISGMLAAPVAEAIDGAAEVVDGPSDEEAAVRVGLLIVVGALGVVEEVTFHPVG